MKGGEERWKTRQGGEEEEPAHGVQRLSLGP